MNTQDYTRRRIFKYEIKIESRQVIMLPKGAQILHLGRQGEFPYMWVSVDQTMPSEPRVFRVITTGEVFNEERLFYLGTIQLGGENEKQAWFVMHVYEVEQALDQINPDPIEERFQADLAEIRHEVDEVEARAVDETGELIPPHRKAPA